VALSSPSRGDYRGGVGGGWLWGGFYFFGGVGGDFSFLGWGGVWFFFPFLFSVGGGGFFFCFLGFFGLFFFLLGGGGGFSYHSLGHEATTLLPP